MTDETTQGASDANEETTSMPIPEASFLMMVASLGAQAASRLGMVPEEGEDQLDLPAAKYTIDMLTVLAEKTEGNLTDEEKSYLDSQLYALRMKFVEVSKG